MGDVIEDAETVAEDGCEFFFQPIFDDLRKRRAVDFMSLFVAHVLQGFRRAGDLREVQRFLRDRAAVVNHVVDLIGIGNDDFPRPVFAEVGKFFQHFVRRPEVQVGLEFGIFKALASHEDFPIDLVFGVHEVGIAGGDGHFPQFVADF